MAPETQQDDRTAGDTAVALDERGAPAPRPGDGATVVAPSPSERSPMTGCE